MFTKTYASRSQDLIIRHQANPAILWAAMNSEKTEKLIWVSHSATGKSLAQGLQSDDVVADISGNDVKKFFSTTTAKLKFLALVGCESQGIIDGFKARGNYDNRPDLDIFAFTKKTKLIKGFKAALEASLRPSSDRGLGAREDAKITLNLSVKPGQSVKGTSWVEMGDRVLAVINESVQAQKVTIDSSTWSQLKNANLQVIRSRDVQNSTLPEIKISVNGFSNLWRLFTDNEGQAIGRPNKNLYIYNQK